MTTSTQWQLAQEAADRYEAILIPVLLGPFARALVDHAGIRRGEVVLDVGCGTGAAAGFAATGTGTNGRVIGLDVNAAMLTVARGKPLPEGAAPIEWKPCDACALAVEDGSADVVLCAQTLQFLPDRAGALGEMRRVLRPSGRVALSVWGRLEENPYFESLVRSVERRIGPDTAKGLLAAFYLTDGHELWTLVAGAGFEQVALNTASLDLDFPPLSEFVPRHVSATPMAAGYAAADAETRAAVVHDVIGDMAAYGPADAPRIPFRSHVITGTRP